MERHAIADPANASGGRIRTARLDAARLSQRGLGALVSDDPQQAGGLSLVAGLVRYAIAVPSGVTAWRMTVRDRRTVMATASAPARPASAKAAPGPAL